MQPDAPRKRSKSSAKRRWLAAVALGLALVSSVSAGDEATASAREWQIKSAFLYNFTKFVEWPASAFAGPGQPIVIGVLGEEALARELEVIVAGRTVNGRAVAVRVVHGLTDVRTTQLLFVSAAQESRFAAIRNEILDKPVLTVGESPSFSAMGAIGFVQEGERLRFEINVGIAERSRVKISAQLQKLATAVRRGR